MIDWLPELVVAILATVIAITLHEAAHGYAALALGDDTAKQAGRLSLNPLRHVDRVGTIILPGILLTVQLLTIGRVVAMFGWAKPVPVNPWRLRDPRFGMVLVAAAGPATNFFLAWVAALLAHPWEAMADILPREVFALGIRFIALSIMANLLLGLFNLLPIPPLDGGRIMVGLLPRPLAMLLARAERFGLLAVMLMILLLPRLGPDYDVIGWLSGIVTGPAFRFVLWLAGHPV
ncbi:MAG: Peptidase, family [Roseomonas sp.]|nr:Peptidase, family [Roseomonas sp.]